MPKNYLLIYSEQLATDIELLCQNIKAPSNTLFQIRKSSSSIYANIREANYGQSKSDMVSKFEIALKECSETEGWLKLLFNTIKSLSLGGVCAPLVNGLFLLLLKLWVIIKFM